MSGERTKGSHQNWSAPDPSWRSRSGGCHRPGPPGSCPFSPLFWLGGFSSTKIDDRKQLGYPYSNLSTGGRCSGNVGTREGAICFASLIECSCSAMQNKMQLLRCCKTSLNQSKTRSTKKWLGRLGNYLIGQLLFVEPNGRLMAFHTSLCPQ